MFSEPTVTSLLLWSHSFTYILQPSSNIGWELRFSGDQNQLCSPEDYTLLGPLKGSAIPLGPCQSWVQIQALTLICR